MDEELKKFIVELHSELSSNWDKFAELVSTETLVQLEKFATDICQEKETKK